MKQKTINIIFGIVITILILFNILFLISFDKTNQKIEQLKENQNNLMKWGNSTNEYLIKLENWSKKIDYNQKLILNNSPEFKTK